MRYVMNSAVIPQPGTYRYEAIPVSAAKTWLQAGPWESHVGYPETARYVERRLGVPCPLSRTAVTTMQPGDEGLVVRLNYPAQDPSLKYGHFDPCDEDWEMGVLTRLEEEI